MPVISGSFEGDLEGWKQSSDGDVEWGWDNYYPLEFGYDVDLEDIRIQPRTGDYAASGNVSWDNVILRVTPDIGNSVVTFSAWFSFFSYFGDNYIPYQIHSKGRVYGVYPDNGVVEFITETPVQISMPTLAPAYSQLVYTLDVSASYPTYILAIDFVESPNTGNFYMDDWMISWEPKTSTYCKDAGVWKPSDKYVKDNGVWKPSTTKVKHSGIWKDV